MMFTVLEKAAGVATRVECDVVIHALAACLGMAIGLRGCRLAIVAAGSLKGERA